MKKCITLAASIIATIALGANYNKTMTVTAPGIPSGVTLTDFPLLVRLSTDISGFSYADFQGTDGSDLHFELADGTALNYDIDTWNETGVSLVWVKVPSLTADTQIIAKWGAADPDANDPTAVWANYIGVWHFNSTSNSASSTGSYPASPISDSGSIFGVSADESAHLGSSFKNTNTGSKSRFKLGTKANNPLTALSTYPQFALSMWVKPTDTDSPSYRLFSTKNAYGDNGFELLAISDSGTILRGNGSGNEFGWWTAGYQKLQTRSWTHQAFKVDGTAGTVFSDGTTKSGTLSAMTANTENGVAVGGYAGGGNTANPIVGFVDEVRLYNGVPTDEYLVAEYAQVITEDYVVCGEASSIAADTAIISAPEILRNLDGTYTVSATVSGVVDAQYDLAIRLNGIDFWTNSQTMPSSGETHVSYTTTSSLPAGVYEAKVVAVSTSGSTAQAMASENFLVGEVRFDGTEAANEEGLVAGSFTLTRTGDTSLPFTVSYTVSSATAVEGRTYVALSGTATFAVGVSSVTIPVIPLNDPALKADASLALALVGGLYGIVDGADSATVSIIDYAIPVGYNAWVATSDGNASVDANWSLGHAPTSTEKVLLGAWSSRNLTWDAAATHTVASWTQTADYTGHVEFPITYENVDVDEGFNLFTVSGDVDLQGGFWQHPKQGSNEGSDSVNERYLLAVSVGGNMTVGSGVTVSGKARGRYSWNASAGGQKGVAMHGGFAIPSWVYSTSNAYIAAYSPYGSILEPRRPGLGASGSTGSSDRFGYGGGAIWLNVGGTYTQDGRVTVIAQDPAQLAGGSGGSLYIHATDVILGSTSKLEASGTAGNKTDNGLAAGSGGRIAIVADASMVNNSTAIECHGSITGDSAHLLKEASNYHQAAAGTIWIKSSSKTSLVIRNKSSYFSFGGYDKAYTPIPADDDMATFNAATRNSELSLGEHARVRCVGPMSFATLSVTTNTAPAFLDLYGNTLKVESVVDIDGNTLVSTGTYTLADATTNGWAWFEDSVGGGQLVVGRIQATTVIMR